MQQSQATSEHPPDTAEHPERRSSPPRPDVESLREAYLSLLSLSLCDLAGNGTPSVFRRLGGGIYSRELQADEIEQRIEGRDWPLHALSLAGLRRLEAVRGAVEATVAEGVAGDMIEVGAWRGGTAILMRATLDSLGESARSVWVADSFAGFPLPERPLEAGDPAVEDLSTFDFLAAPLEDVKRNFARFGLEEGVSFLPGFFGETLPGLRGHRWSLVRLNGHAFDATSVALESLYDGLSKGGHVIVEDWEIEECRRAVGEFRERHGVSEPLEETAGTARWRRESEPPDRPAEAAPATNGPPARSAARLPHARVPGVREIELEREVEALRDRLRTAKAEIETLRGEK